MRKAQMFLAVLLLICVTLMSASAEILTIDLDNASYEELDNAYQILKQVRMNKLKEENAKGNLPDSQSEITFRNIPWGSTKQKAEEVLGEPSIETTTLLYLSGTTVDKDIGIGAKYSRHPLTVAGYTSKRTKVSYVYPVIDGIMLRDDDNAILFFAGYEIMDDTNDVNTIFEDLTEKLSKLYGEYVANDNDKSRIWTDALNNSVQLELFGNSVMVNYTCGMAEELVNEAQKARDEERAERLEETKNNVDGL